MTATGTRIVCGTGTLANTTTICGQGTKPDLWVLYSTDDLAETTPAWLDATSTVRAVTTSRGRSTELDLVDAGSANIMLSNLGGDYDPPEPPLRPLNRWWVREQFAGVTQDIFKGYAESYDYNWPGAGGADAVVTVVCTDEFKILARDRLPTTDPPRDTYGDLVMFDGPAGYWPLDNALTSQQMDPVIGEVLTYVFTAAFANFGAIVGQETAGSAGTTSTGYFTTAPLEAGKSGDAGGLSEFTIEFWHQSQVGLPAATETLIAGPESNATWTWRARLNTDGTFTVEAKNSGGTNHSVTSTTAVALASGTENWLHVVGAISGGSLRLYINGMEEDSVAFTGSFGTLDTGAVMIVGNEGNDISTKQRNFDEIAFYRYGLAAARVSAHYVAGTQRGFLRSQDPGVRMGAVLDAVESMAPRAIRSGSRSMTGSYMRGQNLLDELRQAEKADAVDAVLFIAKDGTVTFLDDGHRSVSPWDTSQAFFSDSDPPPTGLPYRDLAVDYSDSFIATRWDVTPSGGTIATASDATSAAQFGNRPQSLNDLPITSGADASAIAAAMLAKYKDPMVRITTIDVDTAHPEVTEAVFALDIGARIGILRVMTPASSPSTLSTEVFVQSIDVTIEPTEPWRVRLGVTPL